MAMASTAHSRRVAVFLGIGPRRTDTRFCARKNGDSLSASKSSRRASSSSSRASSSGAEYHSSWMVEPLLRAIKPGQLSCEPLSKFTITLFTAREIEEQEVLFHRLAKDVHVFTPAPS